jgi:hypothetical protein
MITKTDIRAMANYLMRVYHHESLEGWEFDFCKTVTAVALCRYDDKTIRFSEFFINLITKDNLKEAIVHEIAHVIAGPEANHGPEWQDAMKTLGYQNAKPYISVSDLPKPKYGIFFGSEMVKAYYRRPHNKTLKSIPKMTVKGKEKESLGLLEFREINK